MGCEIGKGPNRKAIQREKYDKTTRNEGSTDKLEGRINGFYKGGQEPINRSTQLL